jgi:6-phosphogluconolactonase/glucosamine-6-phosphate isomerase/deaminase
MEFEVFDDAESAARAAAAIVASDARAVITARRRFAFAVSGAHTPWIMLRALASKDIAWEGVHVFQVDEWVAPEGHPDRNLTHLGALGCDGEWEGRHASSPARG